MRTSALVLSALTISFFAQSARAADVPTGTPPPDATALVSAPKASADVPKIEKPTDTTSVTLSAGGQWETGNSRQLAGTVNGAFQIRKGNDGFGAALLGNYAEGHAPGAAEHITTQNVQGRIRYDRYLIDPMSVFLIGTGRHDRFEGLDFRLNIDPGVKYLVVNTTPTQFWGEVGYDFQYDIRRDDAIFTNVGGARVQSVPKTMGNHSARVYVGLKHAFNKEVNLSTGVEYIQSFLHSTDYWVNYEAVFAANLGGGFSLGLGFTARFAHNPLPNVKEQWDTAMTASLIYAFSGPPPAPPPPPPPPPPCVPAAPPVPGPADTSPPVQTMPAPPPPVQTMPPPATTNTPAGP